MRPLHLKPISCQGIARVPSSIFQHITTSNTRPKIHIWFSYSRTSNYPKMKKIKTNNLDTKNKIPKKTKQNRGKQFWCKKNDKQFAKKKK